MWYKFDWGHSVIGLIAVLPVMLYPSGWSGMLTASIAMMFFWYQRREAIEAGDIGWRAMKGFLGGFMLMAVVVALLYRIEGWR